MILRWRFGVVWDMVITTAINEGKTEVVLYNSFSDPILARVRITVEMKHV